MKFERIDNLTTLESTFVIVISQRELVLAPLDQFDRAQLASPISKETPIADQIMDLQRIVYRIEQSRSKDDQ